MTIKLELKNKLINGCFEYWQRATSFLTIANGTYFADRWLYGKSGTMVHSALRSTDIQADSFGQYSAHLDVTTAQGVIGAGDYCYIGQKIEGTILRTIKGKKIVLSFWVKSTKVGTYCVALRGASSSRSYIAEYSVLVANTWEKKTIRLQHDTTGAWLYNTSVGLEIDFVLACGASFQTAPNSWTNGNFLGTANQVNAVDNIANDFRISDVLIMEDSEGQSRTPDFKLAASDLIEEFQLCQRYCYINSMPINGNCDSNGNPNVSGPSPVIMRALPALISYAGSWRGGGALNTVNVTNLSVVNISSNLISFFSTQVGTANTPVTMSNGSISLLLDSEL